ncbi:MAG: hybrid sensor histidine kinase/response regulator [Deltaproteobacteria bacterium]|nr:hybrid sensor histidine kinase/response regulator [Deltaproteobacteria bacterium]
MKSKILIVDDVKENVDILNQYFSAKGFQTVLAYGGMQAVDKAERECPDVILLDIMMPDMDGFRVCEILKKERTHFKNIPIILVTAKEDIESKVKGLSLGAEDYVTKPFDIQELEARVRSALHLKKALDELKELNELKNQFLGMASHDIKSPVSRIEKTVEAILKNKASLQPEHLEQIEKIKEEAQGIFNLISDLLNVVKIETGKMGLELEKVALDKLVEEVFRMNQMAAEAKKIAIDVQIDKEVPKILADPARLLEVLENLLTNAIKFTPLGKKITIHLKKVKGGIELSISDEGVGIPKNELSRLFDRFARLSPQPTQGEKGTGLGLSICKQIVDLHKGKIDVQSEVSKGTTFTVFLPS